MLASMKFQIYYFDETGLVASHNFTGGMGAAEIIAATGMILHRANRATINDGQTDEQLKAVGALQP